MQVSWVQWPNTYKGYGCVNVLHIWPLLRIFCSLYRASAPMNVKPILTTAHKHSLCLATAPWLTWATARKHSLYESSLSMIYSHSLYLATTPRTRTDLTTTPMAVMESGHYTKNSGHCTTIVRILRLLLGLLTC